MSVGSNHTHRTRGIPRGIARSALEHWGLTCSTEPAQGGEGGAALGHRRPSLAERLSGWCWTLSNWC